MRVSVSHKTDTGEIDSERLVDFHYDYNMYSFAEGGVVLVARSCNDEPEDVHFLRIEIDGNRRLLESHDLNSSLFAKAIEHLREHGKSRFQWLDSASDNGYSDVQL